MPYLQEHISESYLIGMKFIKTYRTSHANSCSKLQSIVPMNKLIIISCA